MLWRDFPHSPLIGHCVYLCSALRHFGFELEFGYVGESCLLGKELHTDDAACKESSAHNCLPFMYLFQSSAKLPGIAEEDTATSPSHTAIVIYQVSVGGQRRERLCLSLLRDSGSVGSR